MPFSSMVRIYLNLAGLKIRLLLKVVPTPFPLILCYAFLSYFNPTINGKEKILQLTHNGKNYTIQAKYSLLSFLHCREPLTAAQVTELIDACPLKLLDPSPDQFHPEQLTTYLSRRSHTYHSPDPVHQPSPLTRNPNPS